MVYGMPTVSVNIVTYNSEEEISSCIAAVKKQTFPIKEIIILDNASLDNTVKKVEESLHVTLQINKENNGFAGGHNQLMDVSSSDYVLVLNPDVILHKDYVSEIVKEMELREDVGMATGKLFRDFDNSILDSTGLLMKKNRRAFDRGSGEKDYGQYDEENFVFGVSGAAAVYKRQMIDEININGQFFDEAFFAYKEDVDVSWRAQLFGWKAIFVPSAVAIHERGWKEDKKREDIPLRIRKHSYINRYYCMLKNDQFTFLLKHFLFIVFYETLSLAYATLKEPKVLLSWKEFYVQLKYMRHARKNIMSRVKKENLQSVYSYFRGIW